MKGRILTGLCRAGKQESALYRPGQKGHLRSSLRALSLALGVLLFLHFFFLPDLWAFTIIEQAIFTEGPYRFRMEVQVYGRGKAKRNPMEMTSLKVKIKNTRASSEDLEVKSIRVCPQPRVYHDLETKGFPITPAKWVTKYFRLPKEKQILLSEGAYIEIVFATFTIRFNPRNRNFQGPIK